MMAHHDTAMGTTGIPATRVSDKIDSRAYVFWRPGQGERLLAAVDRHRRSTGWGGYIIVRAA